jgi:hypothetical protein
MYLGFLESPFETLRQVKMNDASMLSAKELVLVECKLKMARQQLI